MKDDIQDQRLHLNCTNNLYLGSIIAELDTVRPTYVNLESQDFPQKDWLKIMEENIGISKNYEITLL